MTLVTLAEAQANLAELLRRAAAGEQIVITDGDTRLGALTAPPLELTAAQEAQRLAKADELERMIARWHAEDGRPYPPPGERALVSQPESPAA